ncbi:MAG TPA: AAA family ATPase [Candidatus Rubneribacter avistercoris]|nr:AAA family ATPase [Candidatus Rubneribacter avistercoris]
MSQLRNPFTPSFGQVPPYLAGRSRIIDDMERAFDRGPGDPNLSTILVGARGTGKTALLSYLAEIALSRGWVAASVTAEEGMLEDILERAAEAGSQFISSGGNARVTGVSIGQIFEMTWEYEDEGRGNWRTRMNRLLDELDRYGVGLLITVDEVRADVDEMIKLASVYQHFVREGRRVSLVMAGLPGNVSSLISDDTVSFLRRAFKHRLGRIADYEVEDALRKTVEEGGRRIDDKGLSMAVEAIDGFPYLMQLVGYRAWDQHPETDAISQEDVANAVALARLEMEDRILEATFYELSEGDKRVLSAMLADGEVSRMTDIAARIGENSGYVSVYKNRLVEAGVVAEKGRGILAFDMPGLREYLGKKLPVSEDADGSGRENI